MKKSIYKVPNGKMVRISLEEEDGIIKKIKITGDFFLYPEEGIDSIEKGLENVLLDKIEEKIAEIVEKKKLILFGLNIQGICEAIRMAK